MLFLFVKQSAFICHTFIKNGSGKGRNRYTKFLPRLSSYSPRHSSHAESGNVLLSQVFPHVLDPPRYRQVLCANSFTSLAEQSLHKAGNLPLITQIAEGRERVKGGEAACEALDVNSVFCYQPAMSSCISRCFMFMYFLPPHWVPAT